MEEGLNYRSDRSGRCLFLLGVLLATSVALSVASVFVEKDHDDIDNDDYDFDHPFDQPLAAGVPASRNTRFVPSAEEPGSVRETYNATSELLKNMDLTVDPCDDFYKFSCGNWERLHPIPKSKSYYSRLTEMGDRVKKQLKVILQKPHNNTTDRSYIRKAKALYQSCINEDTINEHGVEPLMSLLRQLGTWPLMSPDTFKSSIDLESLLGSLSLLQVFPLIDIYVELDFYNSTRFIIYMDQPKLNMKKYKKLKDLSAREIMVYEELKRQQATHVLGLNLSDNLIGDINDVMDFEIKLSNLSSEIRYKRFTISTIRTLIPKFDWMKFLSIHVGDIDMNEDMELMVPAMRYLQKLFQLYETTDKRIVANYLLLHIVCHYASYLPKNIRDLKLPMLKILEGVTQAKDRWETCVENIIDVMPNAMEQLYVSTYFPSSAACDIGEMIDYVKESMKQMISGLQWMDGDTKNKTLKKFDKMISSIGYSDNLFNDAVMEALYKDVDYQPDTYFQNILNGTRSTTINIAKKLQRTPSKTDFYGYITKVSASYLPWKNQMFLNAAMLQPPVYHELFPMPMKFGATGWLIGHEMTHAFSSWGRYYDSDGKFQKSWSKESIDKYNELESCYVDQYSKLEIFPGVHNDGKSTQEEDMADYTGIVAAFLAFQQWQLDNGKQPGLDLDLDLSHEQLFFVSYAQTMCEQMTMEILPDKLNKPHSLERVRAHMPLSFSEHFTKVFNCAVGSKMNRYMKCVLW